MASGGKKGMSVDNIASVFGLPLGSSSGKYFQVYEIESKASGVYFTSTIAPSTENMVNGQAWRTIGGGQQTLIPDRSLFTDATLTSREFR